MSFKAVAWTLLAAAVVMSEGLVVASLGLNFSIASMSPVSATTTVISRSCSNNVLDIV